MNQKIEKLSLIISRFFAFTFDLVIIAVLLFLLPTQLELNDEKGLLRTIITFQILIQFYFFFFELIFRRTPGKFLLGLIVENEENNSLSTSKRIVTRVHRYFLRNFSRIFILLPPLFIWNEILVLLITRGKSFSEVISGLRVKFKSL